MGGQMDKWMDRQMDVTVAPGSFPVMVIRGKFGMIILFLSLV